MSKRSTGPVCTLLGAVAEGDDKIAEGRVWWVWPGTDETWVAR